MLSINNSVVAGIIGSELALKQTESGLSYCRFNVSTKATGATSNDSVNWHRCLVTGDNAEKIVKTCDKGTNIYMTGSLASRFTDNGAGLKKEITELVVATFEVVSGEREMEIDVKSYLEEVREDMKKEEDHTPF